MDLEVIHQRALGGSVHRAVSLEEDSKQGRQVTTIRQLSTGYNHHYEHIWMETDSMPYLNLALSRAGDMKA